MLQNKPIYKTYEDFDSEKLYLYAGFDCIATSEVLSALRPKIFERPTYTKARGNHRIKTTVASIAQSMEEVEMPAYEFIMDMEINGIKYDVERNCQFKDGMLREVEELEENVKRHLTRDVDLNSGKDIALYLYEEKGLTAPFKTKSGDDSTDGDALVELSREQGYEFLADLAKRNDIISAYRTFIENYVQDFVKRDGRIHPNYNLHGTSSFRITGDKPNLTQLPRPKHGYNVRECFTVDSGNVFLALDFSSAEVKVLGALCKDPKLLMAIKEGMDFHCFSACQWLGISYDDYMAVYTDKNHPKFKEYKQKRQEAKTLTFAILYGATANGVAYQMGITGEEAQRLMDLYFKTYPGIEQFIADIHAMAVENHYIVTPFNQRKQEFGTKNIFRKTAAYNAAKRNAQNAIVQSTTSTLGLYCFTKLNEEIKKLGGKTLCTVYDSIEIEIPLNKTAEAIEKSFYYMNDYPVEIFDWLDLPVGVEAEIGPNWGKAKVVHRGVTQQEVELLLAA